MFQQHTSSPRSLLISGHLKCPQVNFILAFDSGYEGSTLLDVLLVFFYFEKQERVISPSGHAGRWRWAMGEGISGRGAGIRLGDVPCWGPDSLMGGGSAKGASEGRAGPGPCPVRAQEGLQEDRREGNQQGHLPGS